MATRRTTFGKTQREREKRAKAAAKRERRIASEAQEPRPQAAMETVDEERLLTELAALHERYADGQLSLDEFERRRDELRDRLSVT
jgi:hypothetical protein